MSFSVYAIANIHAPEKLWEVTKFDDVESANALRDERRKLGWLAVTTDVVTRGLFTVYRVEGTDAIVCGGVSGR